MFISLNVVNLILNESKLKIIIIFACLNRMFSNEILEWMNLADLESGAKAVIVKVKGHGSFQKRIMEMGFVKGRLVEVIKTTPFRGPVEFQIMGYHVTLRKSEARLIEVVTPENAGIIPEMQYEGTFDDNKLKFTVNEHHRKINVAFVGNPNCGKTSLFNFTSGSKEHVGNYSGVTVDAKTARYKHNDYQFNLVDLPGTYSLTAYTPEELYVRKYIFQELPDIVVNVIDATNLERNLYLTTQLIDMDIKVVIALNMYDDIEKSGTILKIETLAKLLGIPIIPTVATKGIGVTSLFDKIIDVYENQDPIVRHVHINYGKEVEKSIKRIREQIKEVYPLRVKMSPRFLAVKLLEQDKQAIRMATKHDDAGNILKISYREINRIEKLFNETSDAIVTDAKYGFINGALKETLKNGAQKRRKHSNAIDKLLTHKILGFPVFLFFMFLMFFATFQIGSYPMEWIDSGINLLNTTLKDLLPLGMFNDLITDGVISGLGSVLIFLPNILILFLFISFMEDTGYMARAAFMMDSLMHKIGLHGRSFIPLIMGFGCNVPAIMATRTIRNYNDRLLTMLITPFMSCSARLPIYILFIGAFFPNKPTLVLISLYLGGILIAVLSAHIFNKTLFKTKETPFVMELPPYRMPSVKSTIKHMWDKSAQYVNKIGGVILVAVIIIWALGYFPRNTDLYSSHDKRITELRLQKQNQTELEKVNQLEDGISKLEKEKDLIQIENSYIGKLGHFIEPVIRPLGFDWRMGIAILSGIAAKEVVVSTVGVMLQTGDEEQTLVTELREMRFDDGKKKGQLVFSPWVALSFLIFILIYSPCIGVISAIANESGSWRWAGFMVAYTTTLAWVFAFVVNRIGMFFV